MAQNLYVLPLAAKVRVNGQLFDNAPMTGGVNPKLASGVQDF